jgi:hypothetical protein
MFLGHLGFIVVVLVLSLLLLTYWKPGGVRHAQRISSGVKGKEHTDAEIDLARAEIEIRAEEVKLNFVRRLFPSWKKVETPILTNINAVFSPGEVTVCNFVCLPLFNVSTSPRKLCRLSWAQVEVVNLRSSR